MRVQDIMTKSPNVCTQATNLAAAASILWSAGCGALPVVDEKGNLVSVITDRDMCIALGTRNQKPADVTVADVMQQHPVACRASDDIHTALYIMRTRKIRRLPVVDEHGKLEGVLCMTDLVLNACHDDGSASRPELSYEDIMRTLICIYRHAPAAERAVGQAVGRLALKL